MKHKLFFIICLLLVICTGLSAQQTTFTIAGTVYDDTGETLPGVTVYLKNKISVGTTTDNEGKFSIKVTRADVIVFSFVGYEKIEYVALEEKKDLQIRLLKRLPNWMRSLCRPSVRRSARFRRLRRLRALM
jgi:hypothetical protein